MQYRYLATSLTGFVQQLSCNILPHGYWLYVTGLVPDSKDPLAVDAKLLDRYGIAISRQQRARRKLQGLANLHYIRLGRIWIILATHGLHPFHVEEANNIRDARKIPIKIGGYSLSAKKGGYLKKEAGEDEPTIDGKMRCRVQIQREEFQNLRGYFTERACHRSVESLSKELFCLPYEPYAPIRRQQLVLLRLINKQRQQAGFEKIPPTVLRYKRAIVKPFEEVEELVEADRDAA